MTVTLRNARNAPATRRRSLSRARALPSRNVVAVTPVTLRRERREERCPCLARTRRSPIMHNFFFEGVLLVGFHIYSRRNVTSVTAVLSRTRRA